MPTATSGGISGMSAQPQFRQQVADRNAQEHAQKIIRLSQSNFQLFLDRQRVVEIGAHLPLVDQTSRSTFKPVFGLLGELPLNGNVAGEHSNCFWKTRICT